MASQPLLLRSLIRVDGDFRAGWLAMLPFWSAALPGALVYVLTAKAQGLHPIATLLLSMLVFSGPAQIAALGMLSAGVDLPLLIAAIAAMNAHYLVLGANLNYRLKLRGIQRCLAAFLMTDAACALTIARPQAGLQFFLGAGAGMYTIWNLTTALALLAGSQLAVLESLELRRIVPLALVALLMPLLKTRIDLVLALLVGLIVYLI